MSDRPADSEMPKAAPSVSTAMAGQAQFDRAIAELNEKAYEAIRLLSTPPAHGPSLNADALRSLLSDRLDKIQNLATRVIAATRDPQNIDTANPPIPFQPNDQ